MGGYGSGYSFAAGRRSSTPADTIPPSPPTGITATPGPQRVTLAWTNPIDADLQHVTIYRASAIGGTYTPIVQVTAGATTITNSPLTNGVEYWYKLTASDTSGNESAMSLAKSATPTALLAAPTAFTATPGNNENVLAWTDPAGGSATGINVYAADHAVGPWQLLDVVAMGVETYTDDERAAEYPWWYYLKSTDGASESTATATEKAVTLDNVPPGPPTALTGTPTSGKVTLTWTDPAGAQDWDTASIRIYRSLTSGSGYSLLTTVAKGVETYADSSVTNGTTYYYQARAIDEVPNESIASNTVATTPGAADTTPPAMPTAVVATPGNSKVVLTWTDPIDSDLAGIRVYASASSGSGYSLLAVVASGVEAYTSEGLTNGVPAYYKLTAVDAVPNESSYSSEVSATPAVSVGDPLPPAFGSRIWHDDLEGGTASRWALDGGGDIDVSSGDGSAEVSTDYAHSGTHSLKMTADTTSIESGSRQFRWNDYSNPSVISEAWFYIPTHIGLDLNDNWFNFYQWKTVKGTDGNYAYNDPLWELDIHERGGDQSGGNNYLSLVDMDGSKSYASPAGMDLPIAEWFKITTLFTEGLTDGVIRVFLNDDALFSLEDIATIRSDQDQTVWSVNAYAAITHPSVTNIYVDDIASYLPPTIAPTGGGTIALRAVKDSQDSYIVSPYTVGYFNKKNGAGDTVDGGNLYLGNNSRAFLWFPLNVPNAATISSASLEFVTRAASGSSSMDIYALASDDAWQPSNATEAAEMMSQLTTAKVTWAPTGLSSGKTITTADLKTVVQEIVNRAAWTHDGHILFVLTNGSGSQFTAEDIWDWADAAVKMTVTWT